MFGEQTELGFKEILRSFKTKLIFLKTKTVSHFYAENLAIKEEIPLPELPLFYFESQSSA